MSTFDHGWYWTPRSLSTGKGQRWKKLPLEAFRLTLKESAWQKLLRDQDHSDFKDNQDETRGDTIRHAFPTGDA